MHKDSLEDRRVVPFEMRSVLVPFRKMKLVKEAWMKIYTPVVTQCKLEIRMNLKGRTIDLRTCEATLSPVAIQRAEEFVRAIVLGFSVEDALSVLRLDTIYTDCFDIEDVKTLRNEHLGRAIGRIAGRKGKIKANLENISQTRIVVEDKHIRILGSAENIALARTAISKLIMGSQPSKVCTDLRMVSKKVQERM
ncbi:RNA-binding protein PNO1 [Nematocida sp. AWRm77]|nr:RNA-binding protein PNO1 [Nematocida sp. AWRm77]